VPFTIKHDTAKAIVDLATPTASNRATVSSLTTTNGTLTSELAQATTKLSLAHIVNAALKIELATLRASKPNNQCTYPASKNYCWTCSHKVTDCHTSQLCQNPTNGHQGNATKENPKGGFQPGKE
jgi:hypothetical protein